MSGPAWPAQPALTLCGILSGFPHSFRHYIQGHFNAFQRLVPSHARNYNFALQRAESQIQAPECYLCLTLTRTNSASTATFRE